MSFDVCDLFDIRYVLRDLSLQKDFYKISAYKPMYYKMFIPTLKRRGVLDAAEDLDQTL